jgi:tetratricopeptide (TPR) repeat protein
MSGEAHAVEVAHRLLEVGRPQQALDVLSGAGGSDFEDPFFWWLQAIARLDLDEPALAAEAAREGLRQAPEQIPLLDVLSVAETRLGRLAEAEEAILAALKIDSQAPQLLLSYAHVVARGGQFDKAERLIDRAAELDPTDPGVTRMRSFVSYLRGRGSDAISRAEELLAEDAEDVHAHRLRGAALVEKGHLRGAARSFSAAVREDPTDHKLADTTRRVRATLHPLLWPIWPIYRFGVIGTWIAAVGTIFALRAAGLDAAAAVATIVWIVFVIYSWTVARALQRRFGSNSP